MTLLGKPDPARALDALLARERTALRSADFTELQAISARKDTLLRQIEAQPPELATLQRLRRGLDRNAALIAAASKGVSAAIDCIAKLRAAPQPMQTYGPSGQLHAHRPQGHKIEHKA